MGRIYMAIDLKSFYASVECRERGLDPLTTNLVVADSSRTDKTICLAVTPSLKSYGIPGRPRLFEVVQKVAEINAQRLRAAPGHTFRDSSVHGPSLRRDPTLKLDYLVAPPQMARYMEVSTQIYEIYLKYVAPSDIHVYSIDEVFMDVTDYLKTNGKTPHDFAMEIVRHVLRETGITATVGIGTNLYLAKVAMDIVAKHIRPDRDGVRVAALDEMRYRKLLWSHRPLTDFWRVGPGYQRKLEQNGLFTMGDVARCSLGGPDDRCNEELLYKLFGVNAELLIDHAWGVEPCTIADIKAYRPENHSVGAGQVLQRPYDFAGGRLIVREMTDLLALDLVDQHLLTDQLVLTVNYDRESLATPEQRKAYQGEIVADYYGRAVPRHAHGSANLGAMTSSTRLITDAMMALYDRIVDPALLVRRVNVVAAHVATEAEVAARGPAMEQLDLFTDTAAQAEQRRREEERLKKERRLQETVLQMKRKYGKNAVLKGMNLEEGAMTIERNRQIGGHKA